MLTEGWIKIDRNLLKWRWFTDTPTCIVWIYLLLQANYEDRDFLNITIRRGELVASLKRISEDTGLSERKIRTALTHLEATGEVTRKRHGKIVVISIPNYDRYQSNRQDDDTLMTSYRHSDDTDERNKEIKKGRSRGAKRPATAESLYMRAVRWQREAEAELAAEEAAEATEDDQ